MIYPTKCPICKGYTDNPIKTFIWFNNKNNYEIICEYCFEWAKKILNPYSKTFDATSFDRL